MAGSRRSGSRRRGRRSLSPVWAGNTAAAAADLRERRRLNVVVNRLRSQWAMSCDRRRCSEPFWRSAAAGRLYFSRVLLTGCHRTVTVYAARSQIFSIRHLNWVSDFYIICCSSSASILLSKPERHMRQLCKSLLLQMSFFARYFFFFFNPLKSLSFVADLAPLYVQWWEQFLNALMHLWCIALRITKVH